MKKLVVFAAVIVACVLIGKKFASRSFGEDADTARKRVSAVFENIKGGDEQTAICMWAAGKLVMSQDELRIQVDPYADWVAKKGVQKVSAFSIGEVKEVPAGGWKVSVTVDGRPLAVLVRKGVRIEWAD